MATARRGSVCPSYGHPHTVETYPRTRMPNARAGPIVDSNAASVSSTLLFTFLWLWVSLHETKTAISPIPAARARSRPRAFGQSALNETPSGGFARWATASASASCGIHLGETKLVISIRRRPLATSASIRRSLLWSGTVARSFWRPSRGPTS